jgi:hypothetical protein
VLEPTAAPTVAPVAAWSDTIIPGSYQTLSRWRSRMPIYVPWQSTVAFWATGRLSVRFGVERSKMRRLQRGTVSSRRQRRARPCLRGAWPARGAQPRPWSLSRSTIGKATA